MTDQELIAACIESFKSTPCKEYTCFFELVKSIVGSNEADQMMRGNNKMFNLLDLFYKELKKQKIVIDEGLHHSKKPHTIGLPYFFRFCRIDPKKEIKSITLNYMYGCYGPMDELNRDYVVFTPDEIRYVREPLGDASKNNPKIEVIVNPFAETREYDPEPINYSNVFENICSMTDAFEDGTFRIFDCMPPSVVVTYRDRHRKTYNGVSYENVICSVLCELADKFRPELLKEKEDD